jgi:hypothetical protein
LGHLVHRGAIAGLFQQVMRLQRLRNSVTHMVEDDEADAQDLIGQEGVERGAFRR